MARTPEEYLSEKTTYYIYHVHGVKCGCTRQLDRRNRQNRELYGDDVTIEVLETLTNCTGYEASDKERSYNRLFGYKQDPCYAQTVKTSGFLNSTSEEQSQRGVLAAKASNLGHATKEERKKYGMGFENNASYLGSEKHKQDAARGAKIAYDNKTLGTQTTYTCPRCGKTGQTAIMKRWGHGPECTR